MEIRRAVELTTPMSSRTKSVVLAVAVFLLLEAITLYAITFLFMLEGEPSRHGDPKLKAWAWVCLGAMLAEFIVFVFWIARICKS